MNLNLLVVNGKMCRVIEEIHFFIFWYKSMRPAKISSEGQKITFILFYFLMHMPDAHMHDIYSLSLISITISLT